MIKILVTGAGGSAAFNFIHSLKNSKEKYKIIGIDSNKFHLALSNADIKCLVPSNRQKEKYIRALNRIIDDYKVDLVHPQPDEEVLFLAENKTKINARIFLPNLGTIKKCQNKIETIKTLNENGVKTAKSYIINNRKELVLAFENLKKRSNKLWIRAIKGAGSKAALPVTEIQHAEFWIDYWVKNKGIGYGNFMLSEFLPGNEFAFQSLWKDGELVVSQARQRMEYVFGNLMPSGQSSSPAVAVTVHNEKVNKEATKAVLAIDAKATGVFCIDLKENSTGDPCIMEINAGRFFTTSNFFSVAGCNMPEYYVKLAFNKKLPKLKKYNALKPDLYWIRIIDMGFKLFKKKLGLEEKYAN